MATMNPVVHFELPMIDRDREIKFLKDVFGWEASILGPEMGNYVTVTTAAVSPKTGFPKDPGRINGGLYVKDGSAPDQYPVIVIAVDNIEQHMQKVTAAGGQVLHGPDNIPGVGLYASFRDTEGNRLAMLQPAPMTAKPAEPVDQTVSKPVAEKG